MLDSFPPPILSDYTDRCNHNMPSDKGGWKAGGKIAIMTVNEMALRKASAGESEADRRRWLALPVLLIGAFLPPFDWTAANLALPSIQQDLAATPAELQFVISAYTATYAVFLITG